MIADEYKFYTDYYAYATDMHQKAETSFDNLSSTILNLNNNTTDIDPLNKKSVDATKDLVNAVELTRKSIRGNFLKSGYFEQSYNDLYKYMIKKYGVTNQDTYLTENSEKVYRAYTEVSGALGRTISESNIKDF